MVLMFPSTDCYRATKDSNIFSWTLSTHETWIEKYQPIIFKKILRDLIMCMPCLDMYMYIQVLKSWEDCVWAPRIVVTSINELPYVSGGNLTWFLYHMSTLTTEQSLQAPI